MQHLLDTPAQTASWMKGPIVLCALTPLHASKNFEKTMANARLQNRQERMATSV
jgi:hypothetical protein